MGAEHSHQSQTTQLRSQRDEDIPYTSCTISKPIDGDTPRASPRLGSKSRPVSAKDPDKHDASQTHDIVVVTEGSSQQETVDTELERLENIPVFLPLMRSSLNIANMQEVDMLDSLDTRQMLQLSVRYQEHLKQCGEAVAFDQNALCVRIKEIDFAIHTVYNNLTERQKKFAKYAEQIQKVSEMASVINRIKMSVQQTVPLMERLNSVLPPDEQLEPFSMKSKSPHRVN